MSEEPGTRRTEPGPAADPQPTTRWATGSAIPPTGSPEPERGRHALDEDAAGTGPKPEPATGPMPTDPVPTGAEPTETGPNKTDPAATGPTGTEPTGRRASTRRRPAAPPKSVLEPPEDGPTVPPLRRPARENWQFWAVMALAAVVLLILAWFFVTAFLPRWWSQRIADIGEGHAEPSIAAGLTIGSVFTILALAALGFSVVRGRSWRGRLAILVGALVLASPNLTTLGIIWGPSADARAGEDRLRVFAPGFLGGSLAGAVTGAIIVLIVWIMYDRYRRRGVEIARLRAELERRPAHAEPEPGRSTD